MAEKPPAVRSKSLVELRTEFDDTRARIAARVNEIDARLRTQVHTVVGTQHPAGLSDAASLLDVVRLVNGLKGSAAVVALAGAVAGFVVMRRWAPRRSSEPDGRDRPTA
jgi:hypothetical protein